MRITITNIERIKDVTLKNIIKNNFDNMREDHNAKEVINYYNNLELLYPTIDNEFSSVYQAKMNVTEWLPYLSVNKINELTDLFLKGNNIIGYQSSLPFLPKLSLKKLALKLIESDHYQGIRFTDLTPFLIVFL